MKTALNLIAPVLGALTVWSAFNAAAPTWLLAALTLVMANSAVQLGGRVLPAAAAAAATVMSLLWAYGALAFIVILLVVIAFATLVRLDHP